MKELDFTNELIVTEDLTKNGIMTLHGLTKAMEDTANAQLRPYEADSDNFRTRGLAWFILFNGIHVDRMPKEGERISINTWANPPRHGLYPRRYVVRDEKGVIVSAASSLWSIMNIEKRLMVTPEEAPTNLPMLKKENEHPMVKMKKDFPELNEESAFVVNESVIDRNGHMNNTNYFDIADDLMPGKDIKHVWIEYAKELVKGDEVALRYLRTDKELWLMGLKDAEMHFKMKIEY